MKNFNKLLDDTINKIYNIKDLESNGIPIFNTLYFKDNNLGKIDIKFYQLNVRLKEAINKGFTFDSWVQKRSLIWEVRKKIQQAYTGENLIIDSIESIWFESWSIIVNDEMRKNSGYGELSTYEYLQLVSFENGYPPDLLLSIITKEQYTKKGPDWTMETLQKLGYEKGYSSGLGAMNPETAIESLKYYNSSLLDEMLNEMGLPYNHENIPKKLSPKELDIFDSYLHENNGNNIDCINATLHYYNDINSPGLKEKDLKDDGEINGSIEGININNWYNLSYDEQVEAIGRYNADSTELKKKYGTIVINAIS